MGKWVFALPPSFHSAFAWLLSAGMFFQPVGASAEPYEDRLIAALEEIESVDGHGRWFSYSIALAGAGLGVGLGAWALHDQPPDGNGSPDPWVLGTSSLLMGAATAQVVHGGMRFDERGISARHARALLNDKKAREVSGQLFLEHRAAEARSTRFWGGAMTTAQGLGTAGLGARLWSRSSGNRATIGIILTVMGVLNTGVGAIHFFGKPRSERILDRTKATGQRHILVHWQPTLMPAIGSNFGPGLSASGRF